MKTLNAIGQLLYRALCGALCLAAALLLVAGTLSPVLRAFGLVLGFAQGSQCDMLGGDC